eukprot:CAMPEP_0172725670 /NCGR_PEP_ID=MMETSP1074-20121228/88943_1 /TAXON_ID=2916 /ORGANISM="Ceratium fusus, Strain PA161109" /LENGTH=100 /DNA_ID=CAMNT_0013552501 /DNA_START=909 /DNA_END=1211 /DNA_ORIENTATION=+
MADFMFLGLLTRMPNGKSSSQSKKSLSACASSSHLATLRNSTTPTSRNAARIRVASPTSQRGIIPLSGGLREELVGNDACIRNRCVKKLSVGSEVLKPPS